MANELLDRGIVKKGRKPGTVFIQGAGEVEFGSDEYKKATQTWGSILADEAVGKRDVAAANANPLPEEVVQETVITESPQAAARSGSVSRTERLADWFAKEKGRIAKTDNLDAVGRTPFQRGLDTAEQDQRQMGLVQSREQRIRRAQRNPWSPGALASAFATDSGLTPDEVDFRTSRNIKRARGLSQYNSSNPYSAPTPWNS